MINNNNIRRPELITAIPGSTRVQLPEFDFDTQAKTTTVTDEEIILEAANRGTIDLGDALGQGLNDEQILNRATVRQAAQALPFIVEGKRQKMLQEAKDNDLFQGSRLMSAANSFSLGLTEYVPGALKTKAILEAALYNLFRSQEDKINPQYLPDYLAGEAIGKALKEIFPENVVYRDEFWAGTMAKAAGNFVPQVLVGIATGGGSIAANMAIQTALSSTVVTSSAYEEALAHGATEDEAFQNAILNMVGVSGLEAIPMAKLAKRIDKSTGEGIKKILKEGFSGSLEEGITEAIQQVYSNTVAKNIFDKQRDIMQGVAESFAAGAILGGVANISLGALLNKSAKTLAAEERAEIQRAIDDLFDYYGDTIEGMNRNDVDDFLKSLERPIEDAQISEGNEIIREYQDVENPIGSENGVIIPNRTATPKVKSKAERLWIEWMHTAPEGEVIRSNTDHATAEIKAQIKTGVLNAIRLNEAILNHYGSKAKTVAKGIQKGEVDAGISQLIDNALRDPEKLSELPKDLRAPVKTMRDHIDALSAEFIKRGIIQGEMVSTFIENFGSYIHRSYKLFDPRVEWNIDTIPPDVWNSSMAIMRNQIRAKLKKNNKTKPESWINREAEQRLLDILHADTVGSIRQMFRDNSPRFAKEKGDRDVLMERDNIPTPIRKLMGEQADPVLNYVNTIEKMSQTLELRTLYDNLAEQLQGQLFFERDQLPVGKENADWRYKLDTGTGSKLDNLYMHKDLYEAMTLAKDPKNQSGFLTAIYRLNAVSKYSKTILSHVTVVRNIQGGLFFMAFNGHLFRGVSNAKPVQAFKIAFYNLKNLDKEGLAEKRIEYERLNILGKSLRGRELLQVLEGSKFETNNPIEENFGLFLGQPATLAGKAKRLFGKWAQRAAEFYNQGDDFVRIMFYEMEKASLQDADPNITNQEVADLVLNQYQNYDRLNKFVKAQRLNPAVAPFVAFPAEVIRTTINTAKRAKFEIDSDNPKMNKIGYQRIAGMITTSALMAALGASSQALMRMTDEEDQAIRQFTPPWDRESTLIYFRAEGGKVKYINTSYTNPYSYISDPVLSIIRGDDDKTILDKVGRAFVQLFEPLFAPEIGTKAVIEAIANKRLFGESGEVYNPEDTLGDKLQKVFLHLWNAVEPGTLSSFERAFEPLTDPYSSKSASDELAGLFGFRISTIDVEKSYGFRLREFRQSIRDSRRAYNSVKFNKRSTMAEIEEAYRKSNERYKELFTELQKITEAAQKTGVSWYVLEEIMKDSGLANKDINALKSGVFEPFER